MAGIILVGLGPGGPDQVTREAWDILASASDVWLRTRLHPAVEALPPSVSVHSLEDVYDGGASPEPARTTIVERVLELGRQANGVIYAVPGHPFIGEATCPEVLRRGLAEALQVRIVGGASFLEPVFSALGLDLLPQTTVCDALSLQEAHIPHFPPDSPALIVQIHSQHAAARVREVLSAIYPSQHVVILLHAVGTPAQIVERLPLAEMDRSPHFGALTCLYVPPRESGTGLEALQEIVAHLRAPDGCPWDREQTHASLRRHLLEEAYEVIQAMDAGSVSGMREEFGDLLLQIALNAQIATESGEFTLNDVSKGIHDKIIRRHPHVFGDLKLDGVDAVLKNWEKLKEDERESKPDPGGLLQGVPASLPALGQAQEYQERAARVGFDWPEVQGALDKISEEIEEVREAEGTRALASELGDLLFALVNLARWKRIDAESALRTANARFKKRFDFVEQGARQLQRTLSEMTLDEMEALWQQAKSLEE